MSMMAKTRSSICREQGPAFIQLPRRLPWPYESLAQWAVETIPEGYAFQPATIHTAAGWVRPHGNPHEVDEERAKRIDYDGDRF